MKLKGLINFVAISIALACLYQLSFTVITKLTESDAEEYAQGNFSKKMQYLDSMKRVEVYNMLFKNFTYQECKDREVNLGLDLKGGINVVLDVSFVELIKNLSGNSNDSVFLASIERANQKMSNSSAHFIDLFRESYEEIAPSGRLSTIFSTISLKDKISLGSSNEDVTKVLKDEAERAIERTFNVLRVRIDQFGVTQPNIQRIGNGSRILVELPGAEDAERIRKLLQATANLEFWETYQNSEIFQYLQSANELIASTQIKTSTPEDEKPPETTQIDSTSTEETSSDDLLGLLKNSAENTEGLLSSEDDFAFNNPLFYLLNPSVSTINGETTLNPGPVVGYSKTVDTGAVWAYLHREDIKGLFPPDVKFAWTFKPDENAPDIFQLVALKITTRDGSAPLDGSVITQANEEFSQNQADMEVVLRMNSEGTRIWKNITAQNIGNFVAIVLDKKVYSFPRVKSAITGGVTSITGGFSLEEARDLSNILQAGRLPAPTQIVEEVIIGPTLGKESINAGLISFAFALVIILVYMIFYYGKAGFVADYVLFINIFFIFGVLASFGATLTLPGIAGIILTIGMSVDANVLIFERIKEELRKGKNLYNSIEEGFNNSLSAIIDSNLTTLIVGLVLIAFGTGPVKGFAVTLVIGIFTSLFSAVVISRMIFQYRIEKKKTYSFYTVATKNFLSNRFFDFIGKRKIFIALSSIFVLISIFSLSTRGLNFGVDFSGGRDYVIRFDTPQNIEKIASSLTPYLENTPLVKTFGRLSQVKLSTKYLIDSKDKEADQKAEEQIVAGLTEAGFNFEIMSHQKVGPTIADDIKSASFQAFLISLIGIFFYIFLRFGKIQFSIGAIIALLHDVLIVLGIFSIFYSVMPFSMEINQAFIAAILTVIGYSVNDSVVIFDRLRETLKTEKKLSLKEVINRALNATLSRTLNTSITVLLVLIFFFFFGGEVIRGFSFAILLGLIVGTYSSIYIATPVLLLIRKKKTK